jgi:hypothetical protein
MLDHAPAARRLGGGISPTLMKCCRPLSRASSVAARRSPPPGGIRPRHPGPRPGGSATPLRTSRPATRPSGGAEDSGLPRLVPFHHSQPQGWDVTQGTDGAHGPHPGEEASSAEQRDRHPAGRGRQAAPVATAAAPTQSGRRCTFLPKRSVTSARRGRQPVPVSPSQWIATDLANPGFAKTAEQGTRGARSHPHANFERAILEGAGRLERPLSHRRQLVRHSVYEGERNNTIVSLAGHLLRHGVDPAVVMEALLC